jgi:predicted PurR-regulated permease PerM
MIAPFDDAHRMMQSALDDAECDTNATEPFRFRRVRPIRTMSSHRVITSPRGNYWDRALLKSGETEIADDPGRRHAASGRLPRPLERVDLGVSIVRVLPTEAATTSKPAPEQEAERPPVIRRADVVAFALVALLVICVIAVLYVAKAFFLPVVTAFIVGTMLSPAAGFLERHRIPRSVAAVLIVSTVCAGITFMVGLISSPLVEWTKRLPELGPLLRDKLHVFDRPLALWHQLTGLLDGPDSLPAAPFQFPKFDWVQPTVEFLSPTFTEFLLFFATLVLFIASWRNLRRSLVMTFTGHDGRLRALRILNAIEVSLGGYLLTVTMINFGVGIVTGVVCMVTGMPNPAGLGALAATLNFFPIIGPVATFVILSAVGIISFSTLGAGLIAPLAFVGVAFLEGHFVTPTIIGRRLELNALAVFMALAFWTWLWGPMGGFLSSPLLIVGLILKEYLMPVDAPQLPSD